MKMIWWPCTVSSKTDWISVGAPTTGQQTTGQEVLVMDLESLRSNGNRGAQEQDSLGLNQNGHGNTCAQLADIWPRRAPPENSKNCKNNSGG